MEASICNPSKKQRQQKQKLQNDDLFRNGSEIDISVFNEPHKTTFSGFAEAKCVYESGTDEVRYLLKQECSLIYECKACRNLFRCLFNFIKHKRLHCQQAIPLHFSDNLDDKSNNSVTKSSANSEIANKLSKPKHSSLSASSSNSNKSDKNALNCVTSKPLLENETTEAQAVYKNFNLSRNSVQPEVAPKHAASDSDRKHSNSPVLSPNETCAFTNTKDLKYNCEICNMNFKTRSSLALHFEEKHTSSTNIFQCPLCSITFLQLNDVVCHLGSEHKKPSRRTSKMREAILKRRIQIDDMHLKASSRELKRLEVNDFTDIENAKDMNYKANGMKPTCKLCKSTFEDYTLYAKHILKCLPKKCSSEKSCKESSNDSSQTASKRLKVLPLKVLQSPVTELEHNDNAFDGGAHVVVGDKKSDEDINLLKTAAVDSSLHTLGKIADILTPDITPNIKIVSESTNTATGESNKDIKSKLSKSCDSTPVNKLTCVCKLCEKQFNALSNLRRHISMFHYRSTRFGCTLCDYRAFRRYDIVNHLGFVHKMTDEREVMALKYVSVREVNYSKDKMDSDILLISNANNVLETSCDEPDLNSSEGKYNENDSNNCDRNTKISVKTNQSNIKRKKVRKSASDTNDGDVQRRPIRNRIKAESKDFLYNFSKIQSEHKEEKLASIGSRLSGKKRSISNKNSDGVDMAVPVKITRYRLRTDPLLPLNLELVKGAADRLCKYAVSTGLAAPSRVPELPTERPQIRPRLTSTLRTDVPAVQIIDTSGLEAHSLKPKLFDDSFLEKFATSANPSFRMKPPLLNVKHSPLNAILQRFDATLQLNGICSNNTKLTNQSPTSLVIDKAANLDINASEVGHSKHNVINLPDEPPI